MGAETLEMKRFNVENKNVDRGKPVFSAAKLHCSLISYVNHLPHLLLVLYR